MYFDERKSVQANRNVLFRLEDSAFVKTNMTTICPFYKIETKKKHK